MRGSVGRPPEGRIADANLSVLMVRLLRGSLCRAALNPAVQYVIFVGF